jgi:CRP/FNR family transcriptional regulator, anaerobic regulatory protein
MLAASVSEFEVSCGAANALRSDDRDISPQRPLTRLLAAGDVLFQVGDTHARLYRVERGAVCHYISSDDGRHEIIEFAFPGDIIGFGHLDAHISTAQSMVETEVSLVTRNEFKRALEADGQLAARTAVAADREFDYLRARAVNMSHGKPIKRVASFRAALFHMSAPEGRDPTIIPDEVSSGFVAERLHMSIDALSRALKELERRGLVATSLA